MSEAIKISQTKQWLGMALQMLQALALLAEEIRAKALEVDQQQVWKGASEMLRTVNGAGKPKRGIQVTADAIFIDAASVHQPGNIGVVTMLRHSLLGTIRVPGLDSGILAICWGGGGWF